MALGGVLVLMTVGVAGSPRCLELRYLIASSVFWCRSVLALEYKSREDMRGELRGVLYERMALDNDNGDDRAPMECETPSGSRWM